MNPLALFLSLTLLASLVPAVASAQLEFGLGLTGTHYNRFNVPPPGSPRADYRDPTEPSPQAEATVLYRPTRRLGVGLSGAYGTYAALTDGPLRFRSNHQFASVGPVIAYRPAPWLSFELAGGRAFGTETDVVNRTGRGVGDWAYDEVDPVSHNYARLGALVHAGVGYLRVGYYVGSAEDRSDILYTDLNGEVIGPATARWAGLDVGVGFRFGTAAKRYGRPASVDTVLARAFSTVERRFARWRVALEADFTTGRAYGESLTVDDIPVTGRLAAVGAYRLNDTWYLRAGLGYRIAGTRGYVDRPVDSLVNLSQTRSHEIAASVGVERRVWKRIHLGIDVGPSFVVARVTEGYEGSGTGDDLDRAREPAPRAAASVVASPYVRMYVGDRMALDGRISTTITNPYGAEPDTRLAEPEERDQRWFGLGLGVSWALLR